MAVRDRFVRFRSRRSILTFRENTRHSTVSLATVRRRNTTGLVKFSLTKMTRRDDDPALIDRTVPGNDAESAQKHEALRGVEDSASQPDNQSDEGSTGRVPSGDFEAVFDPPGAHCGNRRYRRARRNASRGALMDRSWVVRSARRDHDLRDSRFGRGLSWVGERSQTVRPKPAPGPWRRPAISRFASRVA